MKAVTRLAVVGLSTISLSVAALGQQSTLETIERFGSYGHVYNENNIEAMRPRVMGTHGVIASGHYLATLAGIEAFKRGGNAFDAGVSAAMALKVTKMGYAGWTGVAPLILYSSRDDEVVTRVGAGTAPAAATLDYFLEHGKSDLSLALVPADVDVWLAALERYGSFSFEQAAAPALEVAESGYHLYKHQKGLLDDLQEEIRPLAYNVSFWFPNGLGHQKLGDLMVNKDLGKLIRYMVEAERKAISSGLDRAEAIRAARDAFYQGKPAKAAAAHYASFENALMTYDDLAHYQSKWSAPLHTSFQGYDIYVCDGWSQGPRLLLFLNLLEDFDLKKLGYNTPEYVHLVSQAIALGMSDSHKYVGDPDFTDTPEALYSKAYASTRAELIDHKRAFPDMPPWGDPAHMKNVASDSPTSFAGLHTPATPERVFEDTTSLNVIDSDGNIFSMTESDGHMTTPMIPGWGFGLGRRMYQFNLDPTLANVVAPHKRPRNTNNPILIMKDGLPFMGLSTPGGDQQAQALVQVVMNVIVWGMPPELALDQPRFGSYNFVPTGKPVNGTPARLNLEDRFPEETFDKLASMGHDVASWGRWNWLAGAITLTYRDPATGVLVAAGDVRRETASLGY